jgi:CheY-like chemotaxis protein
LGLSTCYGIVAQAGGTITAGAARGGGASFEIRLPATDELPDPAAHDGGVASPPRGNETVLVVEDEPLLREMIERSLIHLGYSVVSAASGADALDLAKREGGVELLLADVVMPRMGGGEVARRLRAEQPGLPVLFMSGYGDEVLDSDLDPQLRDLSAGGVLRKPFRAEELARRVRAALDGRDLA